MFRRCVCFLVFITCFKASVGWATVVVNKSQDISLGTYIQLTNNASISWQDAGDCVVSGLYKQATCQLGMLQINDQGVIGIRWDKDYTITSSGGSFSGCQITISNFYVQSSDVSIGGSPEAWTFTSNDEYVNLTVTADVQISEYCEPGTYNGTLPINIHAYNWQGFNENYSANFALAITFNSRLSVNQTQEMDFGSVVKNGTGGTVVLSPTNQVAYNGVYAANSATSEGIFAVDGIAGRTVYITLPSEVLLYNENNSTLSVNNFVSNVGNSLILGGTDISGNGSFNVGATLNIPPNAAEGNYSGTYTVTVSY